MLQFFQILIYYPLVNLLTFLIWLTPGHWSAIGIILLTLIVRFILLIPSKKAAQTQRKMQQLQPLLNELKKEYGDDRQGLAAAQMELYKKNEVNPFGNCVTLLIQLPILITLYYAIRNGLDLASIHLYPWMVRPEFINNHFFWVNLTSPDKTYVLPVLAAVLQYFQVRLTMPQVKQEPGAAPDPAVASQKVMQYFIPASTLLIATNFPSGVALYWIVTTAFGVVQQMLINREKYELSGVEAALKDADKEHPEHAKRPAKVLKEIDEQSHTDKKTGVNITVRRKKS